MWKTCLGHIPTTMTLSKRGVNIPSSSCQLCFNGVDNADHILLEFPIAFDTLIWIFNWYGIFPQRFLSISDFVNFAATWGNCP